MGTLQLPCYYLTNSLFFSSSSSIISSINHTPFLQTLLKSYSTPSLTFSTLPLQKLVKDMCSSKQSDQTSSTDTVDQNGRGVARINGRPVLQPTCNRLERRNSLKKSSTPSPVVATKSAKKVSSVTAIKTNRVSPPISPKKQSVDLGLSCPTDRMVITPPKSSLKGPKSSSLSGLSPPGSIATARREEVANVQELRKMRIAHYGRKNGLVKKDVVHVGTLNALPGAADEEKRCSFITPNSDPIYVAYHDEEWGVPVYDDKLLFELLVLTTAQLGSDWTSVLKKRKFLRDAFSGFDAETVASFGERKITSISHEYDMELSQVRGAVDNANQILKIKREFGSFSNYIWRFVNKKPISTNYKTCQKIPVKTSKSEAISKDLVKRGFRFVGPAVIHSFMQAVGLTNDHLIACSRNLVCAQLHLQQHIEHQ